MDRHVYLQLCVIMVIHNSIMRIFNAITEIHNSSMDI